MRFKESRERGKRERERKREREMGASKSDTEWCISVVLATLFQSSGHVDPNAPPALCADAAEHVDLLCHYCVLASCQPRLII